MSSVNRIRVLSRRSTTKLLLGALFFVLMLAGTSTLAGAASSKASTATISAHLTKTSFTSAQAKRSSSSTSSRPEQELLLHAHLQEGSKWLTVKSVKKTGSSGAPTR